LLALIALPFPCVSSWASAGELADSDSNSVATKQPIVFAHGPRSIDVPTSGVSAINPDFKGWDYVYQLLLSHGAEPEQLKSVLLDSRLPQSDTLYFALQPKESPRLYTRLQTRKARTAALECYRRYQPFFNEAGITYGVSPGILAGILQTETACGRNFGRSMAFYRLARYVSAGSPETIEANFNRKFLDNSRITREQVAARAKWLENTFLPHALAALVLASQKEMHPLDLVGSEAGAIGMPQFLPANLLNYGVDADKSGEIDLFTAGDAILSMANFLQVHGWTGPKMTDKEKRGVIWHYNRSAPYVDTVLAMARNVESTIAAEQRKKAKTIAKRLQPITFVIKAPS
jgi:membrane-bound lytic murein transglycosylase B